ncbi:MAG TPA: response regulator transcription factor [Nitrospira sp.]|nr:response regulator transcription factor [Nitrospira sp.]
MTGTSVSTPALTIMIISRQYLVCLGLQNLLEQAETLRFIVHQHQRITQDLLHAENRPDIFIIDLETERDIFSAIKQIREAAPTSKIVLLSGVEDKHRLHEGFASGVDGVILKVQPLPVVLAVIGSLYGSTMNGGLSNGQEQAVGWDRRTKSSWKVKTETQVSGWDDAVTEREREVIRLVEQGFANKEIADRLCISDSTVRYHLTNIFDKVGVRSRQKLLIYAHQFRSTPRHHAERSDRVSPGS